MIKRGKMIRISLTIVFLSIFLFLNGMMTKAEGLRPNLFDLNVGVTEYYDKAYEVLNCLNAERTSLGLEPLVMDADLLDEAMQRATELLFEGGHTRPDGSGYYTVDSTFKAVGENAQWVSGEVGKDIKDYNPSGARIYLSWKTSAGHYKNMTDAAYRNIGIGIIKGSAEYCNSYTAVMLFGCGDTVRNKIKLAEITGGTRNVMRTVRLSMNRCQFIPASGIEKFGIGEGINHFEVMEGKTLPLYLMSCLHPTGVDMSIFDFSSSDSSIFTVNSAGMITAHKAGTAQITVSLKSNPAIRTSHTIYVNAAPKAHNYTFTIELPKEAYTYTGKAIKPSVTVYATNSDGQRHKVDSKYYSVSYKKNTKTGTATVKVKGTRIYMSYSGKTTFKIQTSAALGKVTLSSAKSSKKKQVVLKWKKSANAQGYQIQLSPKKNFSSSVKKYMVSGYAKTSKMITKLASKKTYYVRVRSYRKVNGTYKYGKWSSTKKVKCK